MLQQYFRFAYHAPTSCFAKGEGTTFRVEATEGVLQGDFPSGWFFCEGIKAPINSSFDSTPKLAFFDDISAHAPASELVAVALSE